MGRELKWNCSFFLEPKSYLDKTGKTGGVPIIPARLAAGFDDPSDRNRP
jgi:hypothetical protein